MAVVAVNLHRQGWTGSGRLGEGNRYTVQHLVESNDKNDGPLSIALGAAASIPGPYDGYNIGNDADRTVVMLERATELLSRGGDGAGGTKNLWVVTSTYAPPGNNEQGDTHTNPTRRPTKYRIDWANYTAPIEKDVDGNAIVNSAGVGFADVLEMDDARPVLVATRHISTLSQVVQLGTRYRNTVNRDQFYGAAPRHAKVESVTAGDQQEENGRKFYPTTFRVQFNHQEWDRDILDQGFSYKADENSTTLTNVEGADPVLLNDDGTKKDVGEPGDFLTFRVYRETNFSGMGI